MQIQIILEETQEMHQRMILSMQMTSEKMSF
ncbi:Uncharacterised protein [Dorea longicatena]|nr:Uncharacterised protein [Dorea longicatena]